MLDSRQSASSNASCPERLESKMTECWLKLARAFKIEDLVLSVIVREEQGGPNTIEDINTVK